MYADGFMCVDSCVCVFVEKLGGLWLTHKEQSLNVLKLSVSTQVHVCMRAQSRLFVINAHVEIDFYSLSKKIRDERRPFPKTE